MLFTSEHRDRSRSPVPSPDAVSLTDRGRFPVPSPDPPATAQRVVTMVVPLPQTPPAPPAGAP